MVYIIIQGELNGRIISCQSCLTELYTSELKESPSDFRFQFFILTYIIIHLVHDIGHIEPQHLLSRWLCLQFDFVLRLQPGSPPHLLSFFGYSSLLRFFSLGHPLKCLPSGVQVRVIFGLESVSMNRIYMFYPCPSPFLDLFFFFFSHRPIYLVLLLLIFSNNRDLQIRLQV